MAAGFFNEPDLRLCVYCRETAKASLALAASLGPPSAIISFLFQSPIVGRPPPPIVYMEDGVEIYLYHHI